MKDKRSKRSKVFEQILKKVSGGKEPTMEHKMEASVLYADTKEAKDFLDAYLAEEKMRDDIRAKRVKQVESYLKMRDDIRAKRVKQVESYLKTHNFDDIIKRLAEEHGDDYQRQCLKAGFEPYPNNKLGLLLNYIADNFDDVINDKLPQDFMSSCKFFRGYWFVDYCGQGCVTTIYDKNLKAIINV